MPFLWTLLSTFASWYTIYFRMFPCKIVITQFCGCHPVAGHLFSITFISNEIWFSFFWVSCNHYEVEQSTGTVITCILLFICWIFTQVSGKYILWSLISRGATWYNAYFYIVACKTKFSFKINFSDQLILQSIHFM